MSQGVSRILKGMRQAEEGILDVEVQAEGNDELT